MTLKEFWNGWYFSSSKQEIFEVRVGLRNVEKHQYIAAFGDLNNDIFTDLITVRGDSTFAVYLYAPEDHKFIDIGQEFNAECPIESINIASVSSDQIGIFLKCYDGDDSLVKSYSFVYSNDHD